MIRWATLGHDPTLSAYQLTVPDDQLVDALDEIGPLISAREQTLIVHPDDRDTTTAAVVAADLTERVRVVVTHLVAPGRLAMAPTGDIEIHGLALFDAIRDGGLTPATP